VLGYVCHPELVRSVTSELALDQILESGHVDQAFLGLLTFPWVA
jgi:hypothetical protein